MTMTPTTDAELIYRLRVLDELQGNQSQAAIKLGLNRQGLRESIDRAKQRGLTSKSPLVNPVDRLTMDNLLLRRQLAETRKENLSTEEVRKAIYGLAAVPPSVPTWTRDKTPTGSPGTPVLMLSDWHWGERINPVEIGGVNSFNRVIAKQRVETLVNKSLDLMKHHMVNPDYPGLILPLGGDMITGDIHLELEITNDGTTQQALLEVQDQLAGVIECMAQNFGRVFVPCVVGNHGRSTMKPRAKGRVFTSFEWNLYCQLERHFRNDKRIQFHVASEPDVPFNVYSHRFLLTHGDALGVKGGDGIIGLLGPVARGTIKVGRQKAVIGQDFDTLIMGHWHTYVPRSDAAAVIVNGALKGYDEFAHTFLRAPYSRPSQALWFVHPKHGITAQWPVYLETHYRHQPVKKGDWVTWKTNGTST
jgi:hypothetical protein